MAKPLERTVQELEARLREHALEMANLRVALDIQFTRIAQMQAELDNLPHAKKRRRSLLAPPTQLPAHNGNSR
jgi:hypothetical protein